MSLNLKDIVNFKLNNSKVLGQILYRKWTRPDKAKNKERVSELDIYVEYGDN